MRVVDPLSVTKAIRRIGSMSSRRQSGSGRRGMPQFLETFDGDPALGMALDGSARMTRFTRPGSCLRAQSGGSASGRRVGRDLAARRDAASG